MKTFCITALVLLLGALLLVPQARAEGAGNTPDSVYTAASLRAAMVYQGADLAFAGQPQDAGRRRVVPLAFGLSALVPGAGQAYNRQWVKAATAIAIEAALFAGYSTWRSRGLDGEAAYQAYAHQSWSALKYAGWLNDYADWLRESLGTSIDAEAIVVPEALQNGFDITNPDGWTTGQRQAVSQLFAQIRRLEDAVIHPETGASFSHKLPGFGEQQYYELIGKYFQFAPGWSDYPVWLDEEGNPIDAVIDPERTAADGSKPNVTDQFYDYARDHGTANDYFRRASRLSIFFIMNHLVAAVDAAVFARLHNDRLTPGISMHLDETGQPQPMMNLRVRL